MTIENNVTFGLIHGAWHGAWCWSLLQDELESQGYKSVAMDLPIDDPSATFDDYADVVTDTLDNESEVVLVGHSRAGNVVPRVAGKVATRKVIYLCASFDTATIGDLPMIDGENIPDRFGEGFEHGLIELDNELTSFDQDLAKRLFFNDCPSDLQDWAVSKFRLQRRSPNEPELAEWPKLDQEYILCTKDLVVNPSWSRYATKYVLGIDPIEFQSGHSPFLSRPRELASLLISLTQ